MFLSQWNAYKFGLLSPEKASSHCTALPRFCCCFLCAVFSCFCNPPNSDMAYGIFNVRTFLCVRIHTRVGHTDNEWAQHFYLEKLSQLFLRIGLWRQSYECSVGFVQCLIQISKCQTTFVCLWMQCGFVCDLAEQSWAFEGWVCECSVGTENSLDTGLDSKSNQKVNLPFV